MPEMKKIEFEFPDPDANEKPEIQVEPAVNRTENVLDDFKLEEVEQEEKTSADTRVLKEDGVEVEVVNDVPPEDRNRKISEEAEEVTDEELEGYSERVKKRIQRLNKNRHDQRRIAEQAQRERDEAIRYAQGLLNENQKLQQNNSRSRNSLIAQAKKAAEAEVQAAQRVYKEAYEAGDSEKLVDAQTKLSEAVAKKSRIDGWKPQPLQKPQSGVQSREQQRVPQTRNAPTPQEPDPKLKSWMDDNSWFGTDDEMTGFAYGAHRKLVQQGVDGNHPDYYKKLDARMRQAFPEEFEDAAPSKKGGKESDSVVAPVTRSSAPKRFKLTESQVALAKRMGITLEQYAEEAAKLAMRGQK